MRKSASDPEKPKPLLQPRPTTVIQTRRAGLLAVGNAAVSNVGPPVRHGVDESVFPEYGNR